MPAWKGNQHMVLVPRQYLQMLEDTAGQMQGMEGDPMAGGEAGPEMGSPDQMQMPFAAGEEQMEMPIDGMSPEGLLPEGPPPEMMDQQMQAPPPQAGPQMSPFAGMK